MRVCHVRDFVGGWRVGIMVIDGTLHNVMSDAQIHWNLHHHLQTIMITITLAEI